MRVEDIYAAALDANVLLYLKQGELAYKAAQGSLQADLLQQLRENKAALVEYLRKLDSEKTEAGPQPLTDRSKLPVSRAQQRVWLAEQSAPDTAHFNIQGCYLFTGSLDNDCFERALRYLMRRHEALRANFVEHQGELHQQLRVKDAPHLHVVDLTARDAAMQGDAVKQVIADDLHRRFDLARDALFRVILIRLAQDRHVVIFNLHHIVADGWSAGLLIEEFCRAYVAYHGEGWIDETPPRLQYADYAAWQETRLESPLLDTGLSFWDGYLKDMPHLHALPLDRSRPARQRFNGDSLQAAIDAPLEQRIRAYCQQHKVSLFMFLETALAVLLARYGSQTDIVIGTPVAGRTHPDSEGLVGLFINTVMIRTQLESGTSFDALLKTNRENILAAFDQQQVPFEMLVQRQGHPRSQSYHPLFQIWFVLQNNRSVTFALPGCSVEAYTDLPSPVAKYELNLYAHEGEAGVQLEWVFNADIFERSSIHYVAQQFLALLQGIVDEPGRDCLAYDIFGSKAADSTVLPASVAALCANESSLVEHLRKPLRDPSHNAVICDSGIYSYRQLNERVHGYVAAILRSGNSARVGLLLERGIDAVAAMLASLQVRRTYVPLDPGYPPERLGYMLRHAGCDLIVTTAKHCALAASIAGDIAIIDRPDDSGVDEVIVDTQTPAYILYTSGSTGQPKGVTQSHAGLAYHAGSYVHGLGLTANDQILQLASYSFDASVLDTYGALLAGATLHLADAKATAPALLLQRIVDAGITVYHSTPTVFKYLFGNAAAGVAPAIRAVVLGGEVVDEHSRSVFRRVFGADCRLIGLYGATESSLTTLNDISHADIDAGLTIGLGRPIDGTQLILRRDDGSEARVFETGQIAIRSRHLARGYWNDAALTAQRFLPVGAIVGDVADDDTTEYLSGDLGCRLPDGSVRFMGRRDFQYKLHGVRIELGEIETRLRLQEDVAQAVVSVQSVDDVQGIAQLVAYVQSRTVGNEASTVSRVVQEQKMAGVYRAHLARWLPDYMLPSRYLFMDALPLTPSGKIDRLALPKVSAAAPRHVAHAAPRRQSEQRLCEIWQRVLQLEQVGVNDNFFDVGGSSMLAMQVCKDIGERLSRNISVVDIFTYPTIRTLAQFIDADAGSSATAAVDQFAVASSADIAIVGIACRFPEADNAETFWRHIAAGHESIRFYSPDELRQAGVDSEVMRKPNYVPSMILLDGCKDFDADHFAFTHREAEVTDPQQRVLLECAHEALESAGYGDGAAPRSVGVFVGVGVNKYFLNHLLPRMDEFVALGEDIVHANNKEHHAATRISYKLNLCGPSISLNTACSTSLAAIHEACKSLLLGECRMALAGGSNIVEFEPGGYLYHEGDIRSPDGHCRAFDHKAAGTRRGNGAALVLLKSLDAALADGDTIHAVVKGSSISNDGADKVGYTAPSVTGQANAISAAQRKGRVAPASIQYIEAHGTGTPLGDPIELRALTLAFGETARGSCAIGSVKPNIGHLEVAAGIAGLVKTVQALKHRQLPPHILYEQPNPRIDFDNSPFYVNTELRAWESDGPRRAGVSSFGLGGTNVHVVLEEAPAVKVSQTHRRTQVLPLSARTETALRAMTERLAAHLTRGEHALADIAYTLQAGRNQHAYRRVWVCADVDAALAQLEQPGVATQGEAASVVLMFADHDPHRADIALRLYEGEPEFQRHFDHCNALIPASSSALARAQCEWFSLQYSLAQVLMSWGVQPAAVLGQGVGEFVAACVAGVFSQEHALKLVDARARLIAEAAADGVSDEWRALLDTVPMHEPALPYASSVTGRWVSAAEAQDVSYWAFLLAAQSSSAACIDMLRAESSSHTWLTFGAQAEWHEPLHHDAAPAASVIAVLPLERESNTGEVSSLHHAVGQLWLAGVMIHWERYHADEQCCRVPLPTYPFERKRYWIDAPVAQRHHAASAPTFAAGETTAATAASGEQAISHDSIEQWLLGVWRELFGGDAIGLHDDFFELGGNSLLATRMLSRVREYFPVLDGTYSIRIFFESPTVAATAEKIRAALVAALVERQQAVQQSGNVAVEEVF